MAEINTGGRQRKRGAHRYSTKVDLTPMVDLGFLLITFFMLTTTLKRDYLVDIKVPVPGPVTNIPASKAMTVVLAGGDKYYYYLGQEVEKKDSVYSSISLRKVLLKQNEPLLDSINRFQRLLAKKELTDTAFQQEVTRVSKEPWALNVVVKANDKTQCQQLVSLMDQLNKARVSKYALVDMLPSEKLTMGF